PALSNLIGRDGFDCLHPSRLTLTTNVLILTLLLFVSGLAGCSAPPRKEATGPEPSIHLTATLISPIDIALDWKRTTTDAAGLIVEFATDPSGEYTIIEFLPPDQTRFLHPKLMPETAFYYRVRTYHGPASNPIEITLPDPPPGEDINKDNHAWAYPQTLS